MSDAENILKLIETVDPNDDITLNEIDVRVWLFLEGMTFVKTLWFTHPTKGRCVKGYRTKEIQDLGPNLFNVPWKKPDKTDWKHHRNRFSRSRDALKKIRPTAEYFCITSKPIGYQFGFLFGGINNVWSAHLPTEELAELHAIIQTIDYERKGTLRVC